MQSSKERLHKSSKEGEKAYRLQFLALQYNRIANAPVNLRNSSKVQNVEKRRGRCGELDVPA